ncbi:MULTISPECIES: hypothetical protein [unclassified Paraflavitalea]|uniref:hypothetical protein n=1 Tax=unclassified Paraflavitalea TaxID=2798305 RepID=UPI003D33955A
MKTFFLSLIFFVVSYNSFSQQKKKAKPEFQGISMGITANGYIFKGNTSAFGAGLSFLTDSRNKMQAGFHFNTIFFSDNTVGIPLGLEFRIKTTKKLVTPMATAQIGMFAYKNKKTYTNGVFHFNTGFGFLFGTNQKRSPYVMAKFQGFVNRITSQGYKRDFTTNAFNLAIGINFNNY